MSAKNKSIILCEPSPKSSRKKTPKRAKRRAKVVKKTFYESPLNHIQQSSKRWKQLQTQRRLLRETKQLVNKRNKYFYPLTDASREDSVIILSDNESDSNGQEKQNNCRNSAQAKKRPMQDLLAEEEKNAQCLCTSNNYSHQEKTPKVTQLYKKRKRDCDTLSENNNTSCLVISDTEDSETSDDVNGENIAPTPESKKQGSDDIVVVWSSEGTSTQTPNQSEESTASNQENKNRFVMIDCNPDPKNLSFIECNAEITTKGTEWKLQKEKGNDEENTLPFSKPGLKFPKAINISKHIHMKQPKSMIRSLRDLEQHISTLCSTPIVPMKSGATSTPTTAGAISTPTTACTTITTTTTATSNLQSAPVQRTGLREIVIDGNNIGLAHTHDKIFSEAGIKLVVDYFVKRGHTVKVFVPQYRRGIHHPLLEKLYDEGKVVFTPSRKIAGRRITPYDDRYILEYATMCKGIVISLDQYRDLYAEKPMWRDTIINRLLAPTFVGNYVMFPEDPLGRLGPSLDEFLRH